MRTMLRRIGHALNGGDPAAPGPDPLHIVADGPVARLDATTRALLVGTGAALAAGRALDVPDTADAIAQTYRTRADRRRHH